MAPPGHLTAHAKILFPWRKGALLCSFCDDAAQKPRSNMLILKKRDFAATFLRHLIGTVRPTDRGGHHGNAHIWAQRPQTHPQRTLSAGISAPNKPTGNAEPVLPSHRQPNRCRAKAAGMPQPAGALHRFPSRGLTQAPRCHLPRQIVRACPRLVLPPRCRAVRFLARGRLPPNPPLRI